MFGHLARGLMRVIGTGFCRTGSLFALSYTCCPRSSPAIGITPHFFAIWADRPAVYAVIPSRVDRSLGLGLYRPETQELSALP